MRDKRYRYSVSVPVQEEYLDAAVEAGVEWLEILGGVSADQAEDSQKAYLAKAREEISQRDLKVASIHLCPWYLKHDEAALAMLLKNGLATMRIGKDLFPEAIYVLHPGELIENPAETELMLAGGERLAVELGMAAAELGVMVAVENMRKGDPDEKGVPRVGQDMRWVRRVAEHLPSLGICLDTGHANISGDICRMAEQAGDKLLLIHLSDNFGIYDDHLFPGEGAIPWAKLGKIVRDQVYFQGILELEINLPCEKESLVRVMKKSLAFSQKTFG